MSGASDPNFRVNLRKTACFQCRKRKLKCDERRPICGNCAKPRIRGRTEIEKLIPTAPSCTWETDTVQAPPHQQSKSDEPVNDKQSRIVKQLEERVALLERALATPNPSRPSTGGLATPYGSSFNGSWSDSPAAGFGLSTSINTLDGLKSSEGVPDWSSDQTPLNIEEGNIHNGPSAMTSFGWPRELPPVETVLHITDVFFDKVATLPKMLRRSGLKQALRLPPTHRDFPPRSLLHAIICITAKYLPAEVASKPEYWPVGLPCSGTPYPELPTHHNNGIDTVTGAFHTSNRPDSSSNTARDRLQNWHRREALRAVSIYVDRAQHFMVVLQTLVLIAANDQLNAWWTDLWQLASSAIRLAIPMRLHEARLSHFAAASTCPGPEEELGQCEADRTWWMAFYVERTSGMWTTWPLCLADDEITCTLPGSHFAYEVGFGHLVGVQTIHDPDLYMSHPACHQDSFTILLKAVKLFADAQRFFRFYRRQEHSVDRYLKESTLRLLLSQVNVLLLGLPAHMRKPTQQPHLDPDLITAVILIHGTSIVLGEPLVTGETWQHGIAKSGLAAIRAILSCIYDITSTSFDLTLLPATASYAFLLAAKALLRFVDAAEQVNDQVSSAVFRSEIGVFQMALRQYGERFPIGAEHAKMLDDLVTERDRQPNVQLIATIEDIIHPAQIPSAVGFMKGSSQKSPSTTTNTKSPISPSGQSPAPNMAALFAPGATSLCTPGEQTHVDWADATSFSFDTEQLSRLFELAD